MVEVTDTGCGIRREMLSTIFEPFVQVERTVDRSRGGLGLGLALVKALAELHGGSVSLSLPRFGRHPGYAASASLTASRSYSAGLT